MQSSVYFLGMFHFKYLYSDTTNYLIVYPHMCSLLSIPYNNIILIIQTLVCKDFITRLHNNVWLHGMKQYFATVAHYPVHGSCVC